MSKLDYIFWNTGFSPPLLGGEKKGKRTKADVVKYLRALITEYDPAIIGLTEVNANLIKEIEIEFATNSNNKYSIIDMSDVIRNPENPKMYCIQDIALIFNNTVSSFSKENTKNWMVVNDGKDKSIGIKATGNLNNIDLCIYILHIPTDNFFTDAFRISSIKSVKEDAISMVKKCYCILSGDFNMHLASKEVQDLFSNSHTRNTNKSATHFYNPFWRKLGEKHVYPKMSISGTHYSNYDLSWRTLDYAFLSYQFISFNDSEIILDENRVEVIELDIDEAKLKCDHRPILVPLTKAVCNVV